MDMDHDHGAPSTCIVDMLWNWNTIDACFIAESWQIKSKGMFAGSCIGIILLTMSVELLRRLGKEYDRALLREHQRAHGAAAAAAAKSKGAPKGIAPFRPNLWQQLARATIHALTFAAAYFVMLLAMYFNGYIIMCIFLGAWLGAFVFTWEAMGLGGEKEEDVTVCCG